MFSKARERVEKSNGEGSNIFEEVPLRVLGSELSGIPLRMACIPSSRRGPLLEGEAEFRILAALGRPDLPALTLSEYENRVLKVHLIMYVNLPGQTLLCSCRGYASLGQCHHILIASMKKMGPAFAPGPVDGAAHSSTTPTTTSYGAPAEQGDSAQPVRPVAVLQPIRPYQRAQQAAPSMPVHQSSHFGATAAAASSRSHLLSSAVPGGPMGIRKVSDNAQHDGAVYAEQCYQMADAMRTPYPKVAWAGRPARNPNPLQRHGTDVRAHREWTSQGPAASSTSSQGSAVGKRPRDIEVLKGGYPKNPRL
ncbi:hypothetical protein FOZ63_001653 [Perkinsus olseni]|nr:hypothetical protein FOZ63_001653 [Perkinsus olseni]